MGPAPAPERGGPVAHMLGHGRWRLIDQGQAANLWTGGIRGGEPRRGGQSRSSRTQTPPFSTLTGNFATGV